MPGNNHAAAQVALRIGADLELVQLAPFSAQPGDPVVFQLTVTNRGPSLGQGVTLSGLLGPGLVIDLSDTTEDFFYDPPSRRWAYACGNLGEGESCGVDVTTTVEEPLAAEILALHHIVTAHAFPADPTPELSTAVVAVGASADLAIRRIAEDSEDHSVVSVEVLNRGPDAVGAFRLEIQFELGATVLSLPSECQLDEIDLKAECNLERFLPPGASTEVTLRRTFASELSVVVGSSPLAPYVESHPPDNTRSYLGGPQLPGGCGLTGLEAALGIGAMGLVRRRLGSRPRRRRLPAAALLLALGALLARPSQALPVLLGVNSGDSSATVSLVTPLGSPPSVPMGLSGSASADVSFATHPTFGLVATGLQLAGAALDLSDVTIPLASPPLFSLSFTSSGVGASLSGPLESGFPVGLGLSLFDLGGATLSFDEGEILATGTYFGASVNTGFDFAGLPYASVLPINTVAQLLVTDLGGGNVSVRLSFPFSVPLNLVVDDLESTVTVAGTLVLEGNAVIPEPAAGALLGAGLLALAAWRRRVR